MIIWRLWHKLQISCQFQIWNANRPKYNKTIYQFYDVEVYSRHFQLYWFWWFTMLTSLCFISKNAELGLLVCANVSHLKTEIFERDVLPSNYFEGMTAIELNSPKFNKLKQLLGRSASILIQINLVESCFVAKPEISIWVFVTFDNIKFKLRDGKQ